jgi:C-terminal processing protease CtpA/Prc
VTGLLFKIGIKFVTLLKEDEVEKEYKPRLVTLVREGGFGFFLTNNNGVHNLNQISAGEPADLAGVLENDRILEINGTSVENVSHDKVVDMIRASGDEVSFLVVDVETEEYFKAKVN